MQVTFHPRGGEPVVSAATYRPGCDSPDGYLCIEYPHDSFCIHNQTPEMLNALADALVVAAANLRREIKAVEAAALAAKQERITIDPEPSAAEVAATAGF